MKRLILPLLLASFACSSPTRIQAQSHYEPYTFTTFAGAAGKAGSTNGSGSAARFQHPVATAVNSVGVVYVADGANNTIRTITPDGLVSTLAGLPGVAGATNGTGSQARFDGPSGIAVDDKTGNIYVSEQNNNTIRKITQSGVVTTLAGLAGATGSADGTGSAARFSFPIGLVVDSAANVFVADYGNVTIRKITSGGVVTTFAGGSGLPGNVDGPGTSARFNRPRGLAIDSAGNLYTADEQNETIRKITPSAVVSTIAGLFNSSGSADGTGSAARFFFPEGVACDNANNVYVVDMNNNLIRKITPAAVVTTLAGTPGAIGSTDGTGSAALFNGPQGIAVDINGKVYVADTVNDTIRTGLPAVPTCAAAPSGLVSWWPADGDANDIQGGSNGTLHNTVAFVPGKVGQAFKFDGTGGYVNIIDAANLDSTTATWDFWLQTTQSGKPVGVIGKHDAAGSTHGFTVVLQASGVITAQIKDNSSGIATELSSTKVVNDGQFHHIALAMQSGGTSMLYIDGGLQASQPTLTFTYTATPVRFGRMFDTFWAPFNGVLDEVEYFNRVLSQDEIQSIYNAGSGGNCKQPVITSPLSGTGQVGRLFVYQFEAARATSLAATGFPAGIGLSFNPTLRAIVGIPSAGSAGTFPVALTASSSFGKTTDTLTITIQPVPSSGPVITSSTTATGRTGAPFKLQITTRGATAAARLSIKGLPTGLTFDPVTGVISGIAASDSSAAATLSVVDSNATASSTLELTFTSDLALPVIVSPTTATVASGQAFTYAIVAPASTGPNDPTTFTKIGTLPIGLSFDPKTGIISGTYGGNFQRGDGGVGVDPLSGGVISNVQLFATNSHGTSTIPLVFLSAPIGAVNISTRLAVGTGDNVLIGGFIVSGNAPKKVLIRAIGPSLKAGDKPLAGALHDTTLELHQGEKVIGSNDDWAAGQQQEIKDTSVPPTDPHESAIVATLASDNTAYTAIVRGKNGSTGIGLAEVYDLGTASLDTSSSSKLANISTRGTVLTGDNVMIGGFIVSGANTKVIARAIGPSLTKQGVPGALEDPILELHNGAGALVVANDDWRSTQQQQIIDTKVPPTDDRESAVVATLPPGNYTAVVRGKTDSTGVALVEVYSLQ